MSLYENNTLRAHLLDSFQGPRRQLDTNQVSHYRRMQSFLLDIRQPCSSRLVLRKGYIVSILLHFTLKQSLLGPFKRLGHYIPQRFAREHW